MPLSATQGRGRARATSFARTTTPGRGIARYYHLYQALSSALQEGRIAPGESLPSEPELASSYGVSRTTVRQALARLEQEGRILRRRGSGTYARETRMPTTVSVDASRIYDEFPRRSTNVAIRVVMFAPSTPPESLRDLHSELNENMYLVQRVCFYKSTPCQLSSTYLPETVARGIRKRSLSRLSLLAILDESGMPATVTVQATTAVAADAFAARQLHTALGAPLLRVRALLQTANRELCAVDETLLRPDRLHLCAYIEKTSARRTGIEWCVKSCSDS